MKKHKDKESRPRKPSPLENLSAEIARTYAHSNSVVIHSRITVLRCEAEETDKSIVALGAALASAKERRRKIEAMVRGLTMVVEKR